MWDIVDLSVGSGLRGSLREHFSSRTYHADLLLVRFERKRWDLRKGMSAEIEAGRIVIVSWLEQSASLSSARIVAVAEDGVRLADPAGRVCFNPNHLSPVGPMKLRFS